MTSASVEPNGATGGGAKGEQDPSKEIEYPDDPDATRCDYTCCAPVCCQKLRQRWMVLFWLSWCAFTQSMLTNGFVNSVVTSLEKRYGLTSKESGAIASFYDVGVVLVLLQVSYFGGTMRRLRVFSFGMAILAFGSFLFALPHFTSGSYQYQTPVNPICYRGKNATSIYDSLCSNTNSISNLNNYKFVFWLAHMLVGIGASPLYTLGTAYLDDNLTTESSPVYLGIFYGLAILGPALGFLGAAATLDIFVDLGPHPGLTPNNSEIWVGAWWLGFVMCSVVALCTVIPLYGFPREMPGTAKIRAEKKSEAFGKSTASGEEVSINRADFFKNIQIVICNPTFIFLSLSVFAESIVTSGVSTFGPKYIETVFGYTSGWAARIFGFVLVPMGGGGMILGGLGIRWFKMTLIQILRWEAILSVICVPLCLGFLVPCGEQGGSPGWAGLTTPYMNTSHSFTMNLTNACNADCSCRPEGVLFSPICGSDQRTFFSPCYAGCTGSVNGANNDTKVVRNRDLTLCRCTWTISVALLTIIFCFMLYVRNLCDSV